MRIKSVLTALALMTVVPLYGCATSGNKVQTIDQTKFIVVDVPEELYNCPQLRRIPDPETLTNQQVADTIDKLLKYNQVCGINQKQIKSFIDEAKRGYDNL